MSTRQSGESVGINPLDDDRGSFFVLVNDKEQRSFSPTFADVSAARRVAYGEADRATCMDHIEQNWLATAEGSARHWRGAPVTRKPCGVGGRMELDDGALPLTRGQLNIGLSQETGLAGTEWQLGLLERIAAW